MTVKSMHSITKEQFHRYTKLQLTGRVNMEDTERVAALAGLRQETIFAIRYHYEKLLVLYGESS
jgi:hypothetical protein